ncbi:MAG: DNA methyltransferase [Bacteroidia bacterium]|nr:DNA methyltransferase [Bacteroidia bacterium]
MNDLFTTTPTTLPYRRIRDESWDFRGVAAGQGIYALHPYPAMFHFGVVRRVLREYASSGSHILDPFMGSGVAAVEALTRGYAFTGCDLNPLAVLLTRVRTTPIPSKVLHQHLSSLHAAYTQASPHFIPTVPQLRYWFSERVIEELSRLHCVISTIEEKAIQNFFWIAFSETVRESSLTDVREFKLIRRKSEEKRDVWTIFNTISHRNIAALATLHPPSPLPPILLYQGDILEVALHLPPEEYNLILTSPPYGDSRTTVAYGQFSRLSLWWLGYMEDVDKAALGSQRRPIHSNLPSPLLYEVLSHIQQKDPKRSEEVFSFFADFYEVAKRLAPLVKRKGYAFFLVGNRRVRGIEIPMDAIVADFFQSLGYLHERTYIRQISNKRLPAENSPTNIPGHKEGTMRYEYLVQLRRG